MVVEERMIGSVPALVWGEPSRGVYLAVHGKYGCKEEARGFAQLASEQGFQTLSIDLPAHGARKNEPLLCNAKNGTADVKTAVRYALQTWENVGLYAVSLGAYFSLLGCADAKLKTCLLLSPVLDMERLIQNMLLWSGFTEDTLRERGTVSTQFETVEWEDYCYVKAHPVRGLCAPISVLMGAQDDLTPLETAEAFCKTRGASLTLLEGAKHYLNSEGEREAVRAWLYEQIQCGKRYFM